MRTPEPYRSWPRRPCKRCGFTMSLPPSAEHHAVCADCTYPGMGRDSKRARELVEAAPKRARLRVVRGVETIRDGRLT